MRVLTPAWAVFSTSPMTPPSRPGGDAPSVFAGVLIFSPDFPSITGPHPGNMVPFWSICDRTVHDTVPFTLAFVGPCQGLALQSRHDDGLNARIDILSFRGLSFNYGNPIIMPRQIRFC